MRTVSIALAVVVGFSGGVRAQCVDQCADHARDGVKTGPAPTPLPNHLEIAAQTIIIVGATARTPTHVAWTTTDVASLQPSMTTQRNWPARHPVLLGTLAGLGVGAAIGAATCKYPGAEGPCSYHTFPGNARALGALTIGGVGSGLGAVVGAIVGAWLR